ncbi:hypothetical protein B7486_16515 [cyanobacterium TDX16]|nr:hypothetical protein B7486_16515 [cyanobacterium TDX16]
MELRDFVRNSIVQVVEGIRGAAESVRATGARVSPVADEICGYTQQAALIHGEKGVVEYIAFDVAVTTVTEAKKEGGAGIHVAGIGLGGRGTKGTQDTSVSRLQFRVPVEYPTQGE